MIKRNLVTIKEKVHSVEHRLLKSINNLFQQLIKSKKDIMDKMAVDNEANSENFERSLAHVKDAIIDAVNENQIKLCNQIETLTKIADPI